MSQVETHTHGYTKKDKEALVKRLHRIEGQVRGIERMVEDDRYCIDILTQISAVNTALESLAFQILDEHVNHCVAARSPPATADAATKIEELLEAVQRFARTALSVEHTPWVPPGNGEEHGRVGRSPTPGAARGSSGR